MASDYPSAIDTIANNKSDGTGMEGDHAPHHDLLADAVMAVQAVLGTDPQDIADTVADRILSLESAGDLAAEITARGAADDDLQSQVDAIVGTGQVGFIAHATVASTARTDHDLVIWYGSVEPDNAEAPDVWIEEGSGGGGGGDDSALQAHVAQTTAVHGIVDASLLVYSSDSRLQPTIGAVVSTGAHTILTTDAGKVIEFNTGATPATLTIPAGLSTAFPIDGVCEFFQMGTGPIDVDGSAVTLRAPDSATGLDGQYRSGYLRRRATNDWVLSGAVS